MIVRFGSTMAGRSRLDAGSISTSLLTLISTSERMISQCENVERRTSTFSRQSNAVANPSNSFGFQRFMDLKWFSARCGGAFYCGSCLGCHCTRLASASDAFAGSIRNGACEIAKKVAFRAFGYRTSVVYSFTFGLARQLLSLSGTPLRERRD